MFSWWCFTLYMISFSKQLLKVLFLAENLRKYYLLQFYWLQLKKGQIPISIYSTSSCIFAVSLWDFIAHCLGLLEHAACQFHAPALVTLVVLCPLHHHDTHYPHQDTGHTRQCHSFCLSFSHSLRENPAQCVMETGVKMVWENRRSLVVALLLQTHSLAFYSWRGREWDEWATLDGPSNSLVAKDLKAIDGWRRLRSACEGVKLEIDGRKATDLNRLENIPNLLLITCVVSIIKR